MEALNQVWNIILSCLGGLSVGAIVSAVICGVLRGAFSKTISKLNVKGIAEETVKEGVEQIKKVSFKQNIQPLVESELKKITEEANRYIESQIKIVNDNYADILNVFKKFAAYFDESIGVPDEKKQELKQAILEAENRIAHEEIDSSTEETKEVLKTIKNNIEIER